MNAELLKESLHIAQRDSAALVRQAMAGGTKALAQASSAASSGFERGRLSDAAEKLHRNGPALADLFPALLAEEMQQASVAAVKGKGLSFDSLELMAEDQVDDTVELVRGQQVIQAVVEPELVQLNALMSALQGHDGVQGASNPLRPEVWVKALHRMLGKGGVPAATRALWMQHTCPAFGPELAAVYRRVSDHIMQQGVAAAAYKVAAPKHEQRRKADAVHFTLRDLKRLLVHATRNEGETQGLTRPAGQTLNGMTMPAAMVALQGMNKMDDVVRRMQERWRSGVWHAERAGEQAGVAEYTPQQTLAREVVKTMVENISADSRLLPDIQHMVRKLEAPLLNLVLHDQRFFTDKKHPARELLEEITQRSLAWAKQDAAGFNDFFQPLHEATQLLSGADVQDAEPFHFTLQTLRESWQESEDRARKQRASVAKALIKADARNHAASAVAARLRDRLDVGSAPPDVRGFVLGPWAQVIAAASVASPEASDPGGYEAMINDIVWGLQPKLAAQNPAKQQAIAQKVLPQVRDALKGIGAVGADVDPFLARLRGETAEPTKGAEMVEWHADALPWLTPEEVQDSQLMQPIAFASTRRVERSAGDASVADLAVGQYVEVLVNDTWARWKLSWSSPHGSMLMFTDAAGKPHSSTTKTLEKMIDAGNARLLSARSVVDSALDAVAQAALDNETHSPM